MNAQTTIMTPDSAVKPTDKRTNPLRRILLSVSNKEKLKELCEFFVSLNCELVATTSTLKSIEGFGLPCTSVDAITQFPEILGGRVKTLHPKIFGGILGRETLETDLVDMHEFGIKPFDVVVCNLYPFEQVLSRGGSASELIENIDIGGVTLLRAAAKNHAAVAVLCDVADYKNFIRNVVENGGSSTLALRQELAVKAFQQTAAYDRMISNALENIYEGPALFPEKIDLSLTKVQSLRYGENPHQKAAFYKLPSSSAEPLFRCLHGKELSYNNMLDMEHALRLAREFKGRKAVLILKHNTPCGVGISDHSLTEAYVRAFEPDPVSPFGGVVCVTDKVTEELALKMSETFLEVVFAPAFENKALEILQKKKNLRLVTYPASLPFVNKIMYTHVQGGFLAQETDSIVFDPDKVMYPTVLKPSADIWPALKLAMTVVKYVRSNAIVIANSVQTLAIAGGFTNRRDAVELCLKKLRESAIDSNQQAAHCVLASDAFFPFADSIELIKDSAVKHIIQPGGSVQDEAVVASCDKYGISMVFTGYRHFKH